MALFDWIRSDLHNLNLDWIISKIKTVEESEQGAVDAAADAKASKTAAASSATAANNSKTAAAASATAAAGSAAQAQALVDQLDTTIAQDVSEWLENNLTPTSPPVDDTLTIQGAAADAKKTGDEINDLKTKIGEISEHTYNLFEVGTANDYILNADAILTIANDVIMVTNTKSTNQAYATKALDVSQYNTVTVSAESKSGTGTLRIRVGGSENLVTSGWSWIGSIGSADSYATIDVTEYNYIYLSFYAAGNTSIPIDAYSFYEGVMVTATAEKLPYIKYGLVVKDMPEVKETLAKVSNKITDRFLSVAHMGGYYNGKNGENRRSAITNTCNKKLFNCLEIDVQYTSDAVPVCIHLDSYTASQQVASLNGTYVDITISEHTYVELLTYRFWNEVICTLDEVVNIAKRNGFKLIIDKAYRNDEIANLSNTFEVIRKYDMFKDVIFYSNLANIDYFLNYSNRLNLCFIPTASTYDDTRYTPIINANPNCNFYAFFDYTTVSDLQTLVAQVTPNMSIGFGVIDTLSTYEDYFVSSSFMISNKLNVFDVVN